MEIRKLKQIFLEKNWTLLRILLDLKIFCYIFSKYFYSLSEQHEISCSALKRKVFLNLIELMAKFSNIL